MDENEKHRRLEELCGGVNAAFRLRDIYVEAQQDASGNQFTLRKLPTLEQRFRRKAADRGYSSEAIEWYLKL